MKSVLFVWGGWAGHEPKQCVDVFAPLMEQAGYAVTICDTLDVYLDAEALQHYDLISQVWTMGDITRDQLKGLTGAVNRGLVSAAGTAGWAILSATTPITSSSSAGSGWRIQAV